MADTVTMGGASASPEDVNLLNTQLVVPESGTTPPAAKEDGVEDAVTTREPGDEHEDEEDLDALTAKRDTELEAAETEEDRTAIQARRRDERKLRNERRRERIDSLERTNAALKESLEGVQAQVASLSNFATGIQLQQLDTEIAQAENAHQYFKTLAGEATTKGDGSASVDNAEKAAFAAKRAADLKGVKARFTQANNRPAPADPRVSKRATDFVAKHAWYKGPGGDPDSAVLATLDNAVAQEGFDPLTDAYWAELEVRGKKYLPHRFSNSAGTAPGNNDGNERRAPKQAVPGASGNGNNSGGRETFRLSEARVQAMKDSGNWDDPAKRTKMIANYRAHDAANKA